MPFRDELSVWIHKAHNGLNIPAASAVDSYRKTLPFEPENCTPELFYK